MSTPPPEAAPTGPLAVGWRREAVFVALALTGLVVGFAAERMGMGPLAWGAYAVSYAFGGWDGLRAGLGALRQRRADIDLLMILAAVGALAIGAPFEGAMLLFLFSLSNLLQDIALGRSRRAIGALMDLRPDVALVRRDGALVELPVGEVEIGETIRLKPGDRVPLDGEVLTGRSLLDQASLTGESVPVEKNPGDAVFAGTVNGGGALDVRVTTAAGASAIARVIQLVEQAQGEKAETQRLLDRFEQPYALGVIALTLIAIALPPLAWGEAFRPAFYRAMTLMVAASPCALIISTPAAVLSAIAAAARRGVLFKGGAYVEAAGTVRAVVFDKTGTLTTGQHRLTDVVACEGERADEVLALAASVQASSEHHLGAATVTAAREHRLDVPLASGFQASVGRGVSAVVDGREVAVGNARFYAERRVARWSDAQRTVSRLEAEGKTAVVVAVAESGRPLAPEAPDESETEGVVGWRAIGVTAFADAVRTGAPEAIRQLREAGVERIVLLTGDNRAVAEAVGRAVGVDAVVAEALPETKVDLVRSLQASVGPVAMVGDGVNDAPALAAATLGVAMGAAGTDAALETADLVLMGDDLLALPFALRLSRRARRTLAVNLGVSLAAIAVMVMLILTVGLALPIAVVGHEGSTVLVSLNGLRLLAVRR
nr:heavy metal translocating P-type ATPase [Rubricoccus marinus]